MMNETPLFFGITHEFFLTLNQPLADLCVMKTWDKGMKQYLYLFRINKMEEVIALTEQRIFFPKEAEKVMEHLTINEEEITPEAWKGKSGFEVTETPNVYIITEHKKSHQDATPRKTQHQVPKERATIIWQEIMMKLDKETSYRFKYLARKVCEQFKLERFFRPDSESFDEQKFQGSRGEAYFPYYYYPLKVLEHYGLITRRGQNIKRNKDTWEIPTTIKGENK